MRRHDRRRTSRAPSGSERAWRAAAKRWYRRLRDRRTRRRLLAAARGGSIVVASTWQYPQPTHTFANQEMLGRAPSAGRTAATPLRAPDGLQPAARVLAVPALDRDRGMRELGRRIMSNGPHPASVRALDLTRPEGLAQVPLTALVGETIARLQEYSPERVTIRLLHELSRRLSSALATSENRFSAAYLQELLGTYFFWQQEFGVSLQGEVFLELGAGAENPLGVAVAMVALGAERAFALELTPMLSSEVQACALADELYWLQARPDLLPKLDLRPWRDAIARNVSQFDQGALASGRLELTPGVRLITNTAERTGIESGSVDRVASTSFLEHVDDPEGVVVEIARVTKRGGLSIHNVDASDHGLYWGQVSSPVAFLLEAPDGGSVRGCNRVRIPSFVSLFARHGFTLLRRTDYATHRWSSEELAARVATFAAMDLDEIAPLKSVLVFRRDG